MKRRLMGMVLSCALALAGGSPGWAGQDSAPDVGGGTNKPRFEKLSPSVKSCAVFDPVTQKSKLGPCAANQTVCQPNVTSTPDTCSVNAGQCRGVSETLTGLQTITYNDGCGSTWKSVKACVVSCPCVDSDPSNDVVISTGQCGNLHNSSCGNGTKQVIYRNSCGNERTQTEECSVTCNNCTLDGITVAHNQSYTFYNSRSVAFGGTCSPQSRTCVNGTLNGQSSFQYAVCNPDSPQNCSVNGTFIAHGAGMNLYSASTVGCGQSCNPVRQNGAAARTVASAAVGRISMQAAL